MDDYDDRTDTGPTIHRFQVRDDADVRGYQESDYTASADVTRDGPDLVFRRTTGERRIKLADILSVDSYDETGAIGSIVDVQDWGTRDPVTRR